jgi:hypothetical protein
MEFVPEGEVVVFQENDRFGHSDFVEKTARYSGYSEDSINDEIQNLVQNLRTEVSDNGQCDLPGLGVFEVDDSYNLIFKGDVLASEEVVEQPVMESWQQSDAPAYQLESFETAENSATSDYVSSPEEEDIYHNKNLSFYSEDNEDIDHRSGSDTASNDQSSAAYSSDFEPIEDENSYSYSSEPEESNQSTSEYNSENGSLRRV